MAKTKVSKLFIKKIEKKRVSKLLHAKIGQALLESELNYI